MKQRPRRKRLERYGLAELPMGDWVVEVKPFTQRPGVYGFRIVSSDAGTGDRVIARVYECDDGDFPRESTGIPERIDPKQVWHLQRLEPRVSKAYGGTIATLKRLTVRADEQRAWVITQVMAERGNDDAVIGVLKKYGGFKDVPDPELPGLLVRRPESRKRG
jgi:hypothetical protein